MSGFQDAQVSAIPRASDWGYRCWSCWPPMAGATNATPVSGNINAVRFLPCPAGGPFTSVEVTIPVGGGTLTAGQNLIGIYRHVAPFTACPLIGITADQSGIWTAAGTYNAALTVQAGQRLAVGTGETLWALFMSNGTTPATVQAMIANGVRGNFGMPAASTWYGRVSTGQTALPATFDATALTAITNGIGAALFGVL